MLKIILNLLVLILLPCSLKAYELKGRVVDILSKKPIENVNVYEKRSKAGTVTDDNGNFSLSVETDDSFLNFSHIAYESKAIKSIDILEHEYSIIVEMKEIFLELDEVVVTSMKCPYLLTEVPVYTETIGKSNIRDSGAISVGELIEKTLGISKKYDVHGSFDYNLSGLDSKYVLVLKDGRPINGRFNDKLDLDQIAVSNIEKIEITKGPGSSLYGSEAMGGIINIITDNDLSKQKFNFQLRNNFYEPKIKDFYNGSKGNIISLNYIRPFKSFEFQSSLLSQKLMDNSLFNALGKDEINKLNFDSQLIWKSKNNKTYLTVKTSYFDQFDSAQQITTTGLKVSSNSTNINRKEIYLEYIKDISRNLSFFQSVSNAFYSRKYDQDGIDETFIRKNRAKEHLIDYESRLTLSIKKHQIIGGFEYSEPTFENERLKDKKHVKILKGIFVQDQFILSDKLDLTSGFRVDQYGRKTVLNPRIATLYKMNDNFKYRLSYGEGFRAPSIQETFIDFYNVDQGYKVIGNPLLEPEKSKGFNLNLEFSNRKSSRINVLYYFNRFSNKIFVQQIGNGFDSPTIFTYQNISKASYQGFEFFYDYVINSKSSINLNFNFRDNRDKQGFFQGNILENTIPFSTGLRYIKNFSANKIKLIMDHSLNYRNDDKKSFSIVDLKLCRTLSSEFSLNIGVKNLGDYQNSNFGPFQGRLTYLEFVKQ